MKGSMTAQNSFLLDALHVFVGVAVTVLAVFAFLSPEEHPLFFSLIFGLAGILALANGAPLGARAGTPEKRNCVCDHFSGALAPHALRNQRGCHALR